MTTTGQCLCGQVKYQLSNPPLVTGVCHCKNCQRQAGSAFSTLAAVAKADFDLRQGQLKLYQDDDTASGNPVQRFFCGDCGSPVYSAIDSQEDRIFLKTGTLDDNTNFMPQFHVWRDSKQPWVTLDDNVPSMPQNG